MAGSGEFERTIEGSCLDLSYCPDIARKDWSRLRTP